MTTASRKKPPLLSTALFLVVLLAVNHRTVQARLPPVPSTVAKNVRGGGGGYRGGGSSTAGGGWNPHDDDATGDASSAIEKGSLWDDDEEKEEEEATSTTMPIISAATATMTPKGGGIVGVGVSGAYPPPTANIDDGASIPTEIFNLVKSIVGAGVLGLPAGIAAFGGTSMALIPAVTLMTLAGLLSGYCFSLIGRACAYTGAKSYRQAWERAVSPKTAWIPAAACFMVTSCSVLAYSMILSVTLPSLASAFLGVLITRTQALVGVTTVALLPLCLMKSLKSLGPFSLVGIMGMFYTCIAMFIRWMDGSYGVTGRFIRDLPLDLSPRFGRPEDLGDLLNPNIFLLVSMLSTAFMAHYNAPKFYLELKNNTLRRYNTVVGVSFFVSLLLFVAVASFGFATFGKACSGLVLNNYSTDDKLMSLSRVAVAVSLLFSYPLAFGGVRDGLLDLLKVEKRPDSLLNTITVLLLTMITGLAYALTDLRKLLAFNGATWGNAVIYLLPTYMFIQCAKNLRPELRKEVPIVALTGLIGLAMGLLGTAIAVSS